jgi:hypothetical protein
MVNLPDGTIPTDYTFQINHANFHPVSGQPGKYTLRFVLKDSEYKRCQHAIGDNIAGQTPRYWSNVKYQTLFQIPNYIVKLFKKNNTGSTDLIESCWQPLNNFNYAKVMKYKDSNINNGISIPTFGRPLTPYYFSFNANSYSNGYNAVYSKIEQYNAFDSNNDVYYEFDKDGGYRYEPYNQVSGSTNINAQAVRNNETGDIGNYAFGYSTDTGKNFTNTYFEEPGIYLLTITRNAIDNTTLGRAYFNGNPTSLIDYTNISNISSIKTKVIQAYLRIDPPIPSISYNPSTDIVNFEFDAYGSVNYFRYDTNTGWVISNNHLGKSNFIAGINGGSETFSYNPSSSNPNGSYPTTNVSYTITPSNSTNAKIQASTTLTYLRLNLNTTNDIYIKGGFQYDFRLCSDTNADQGFNPYRSDDFYTNIDSNLETEWNKCFGYYFSNWSALTKTYSTRNTTFNKNLEIFNVSTTSYITSGVIPNTLSFNTELVDIGDKKFIFRSYWTEDKPTYLTNNLVGSKYTLRLYKKSSTSTGTVNDTYLAGPVNNYKYDSSLNTGLDISASWNGSYQMNVYTDKSGNISYNIPPSTANTWSEAEILGHYIMVLQRNFSSTTTPYFELNGSYTNRYQDGALRYYFDPTTGFINQYEHLATILYADANIVWKIDRFSDNNTYNLTALGNTASASVTDISSAYNQSTNRTGELYRDITNYFNVGSVFTDNLGYYGTQNIPSSHLTNAPPTSNNYKTNRILIFPEEANNFNSEFVKIGTGTKYALKSTWEEKYFNILNPRVINDYYVLRMYDKDPSSTTSISINDTYTNGPVNNYKYVDSVNTGLSISTTWKTTSPNYNTMEVYTDKNGNISYNTPLTDDTNGWTENELFGSKIITLQRNYTPIYNGTPYLVSNACYAIKFNSPSINYNTNSTTNEISQFYTTSNILYDDATNNWNINRLNYDDTTHTYNPVNIPLLSLSTKTSPTISEINDAYGISTNKTGLISNTINNRLDVGTIFTETLSNIKVSTNTFSKKSLTSLNNLSSNTIIIFPDSSDNYFDSSFIEIGSGNYILHSRWYEKYPDSVEKFKTNAEYTLRMYNKSTTNTILTLNEQYLSTPVQNYKCLSNEYKFTMQQNNITAVAGLLYINDTPYGGDSFITPVFLQPPFNDVNCDIITQTEGILSSSGVTTTIDLTKPLKFYTNIGYNDTVYISATSIGQTGDTYNATFPRGQQIIFFAPRTFGTNIQVPEQVNWQTPRPPYIIDVYTDKLGNVYSSVPNAALFNPWSENDISGAALIILQRNYTYSEVSPLYITTNSCYNIRVSDPSINYLNSNNLTPSQFTTVNTILYSDTVNIWYINRFSNNTNYELNISDNNSTPTITDISNAYKDGSGNVISTDRTGVIYNRVSNNFDLKNYFTENIFDSSLNCLYFNNEEQTNYNVSSNTILIFPDNSSNYFDTEIIKIGSEYLFRSTWTELYPNYLTNNLVNSPYVLRMYDKVLSNNSSISVNDTYTNGPVNNYKYVNNGDTGLEVSNTWKTNPPNSPHTMEVYTDKNGTIFYNSPPANYSLFVGWSETEIAGARILSLQRNYSVNNNPLYILTNSAYSINVSEPSLVRINDTDNFMSQVNTTNTILYGDATNQWSVYEYDTTNNISIPNSQLNIPNPTRTQINSAYPLRVGPGAIKNTITNRFNIGSTLTESLGTYGNVITSFINNEEQTVYNKTTNTVNIYDTRQTHESSYNLNNMNFTFQIYDSSKVYFDIDFQEPNSSLLRPEAYDINIFNKVPGSGTALSQWYPDGKYSPYVYVDDSNRGITIPKTNVPTELGKYKIDASGQVFSYGQTVDFSGSFKTGGYFITWRRNFYKGTTSEPNAKEPFYTLNSQYVYVPPNQENTPNYSLPIYDSFGIEFDEITISSVQYLKLKTPIFNSYKTDGSTIDICYNLYINIDDPSFNPKWQQESNYNVNGDEVIVNIDDYKRNFAGLGDIDFIFDITYNWSAPSQFTLPIGEIGGIYPTINEPSFNSDISGYPLKYPENRFVKPNMAISKISTVENPIDSSYARLNEVKELQAEFIGSDSTRMLAVKWREPNVNNLNTTYTGYPYALRLFKKEKDGFTENDQWYNIIDNSGIDPYKFKPDYYANSPDLSNLTYDGVEISANFYPQITNDNYLYFFSDASGTVHYNNYPSDTSIIKPFTEAGGYILVVQRHYTDLSNNRAFTTFGQYVSFIPTSSTNPWDLTDTNYPIIASNPNPYSSFEPSSINNGAQNLKFYWTLEIPNIGYNSIINGEDTSGINVEKIQQEFRNRGKEAFITSYVTYDFGIDSRPFIERYPLLRINGNPNYTTASKSYTTNLCSTTVPLSPPEWPRFRPECIDATPEEQEAYQMRRKAETLFHVSNRNDMRNKKKHWYSFVAQGYNQKHQTYASQTDKYTNPNTKNYPILGQRSMTLPDDCPKKSITASSTSSDVPGPAVPLTYDPSVPLINYKVFRTYTNSETEYDEKNKE